MPIALAKEAMGIITGRVTPSFLMTLRPSRLTVLIRFFKLTIAVIEDFLLNILK